MTLRRHGVEALHSSPMRHARLAFWVFASLLTIACGGRIYDADGGALGADGGPIPSPTGTTPRTDASVPVPPPTPTFDAGPPVPPPPQMCSPMSGSGTVSTNGCSVNEDWSCGATKYTVYCTCPLAQCTCVEYGKSKWQVQYPNGCPSCSATGKQLAQLCGFPSQ